jgi:type IV pilus assembly protein PilW
VLKCRVAGRRNDTGVSLVETMVALVLGLFLILGAVTAYTRWRDAYAAAEGLARLQEVGRLALAVVEADVRMSSYWGLTGASNLILNRAAPGQATAFSAARQARIDYCGGAGSNWAIHLDEYIGGWSNAYGLACPAYQGSPVATSDVLVLRRANETLVGSMAAGRLHVQSERALGALFVPTTGCTSAADSACLPASFEPASSQTHALEARAYYVATGSTARTDVPSLRRKSIGNLDAASLSDAVTDEEIAAGVEDLQVRFGVDSDGDGNADTYVDPGAAAAAGRVISATLWLRVRAEDRDMSHVDDVSYQYADMAAAFRPLDHFRRIVVTKTIQLRNVRP